jgi:mRNA-degrading endonuclease RelE of RelBE toxin-antitoxin system
MKQSAYSIEVTHKADKMLGRLDRIIQTRIKERIEQLARSPYDHRISNELETEEGQRYSRVGDWRIIYGAAEHDRKIVITSIQHRSKVYKEIKK